MLLQSLELLSDSLIFISQNGSIFLGNPRLLTQSLEFLEPGCKLLNSRLKTTNLLTLSHSGRVARAAGDFISTLLDSLMILIDVLGKKFLSWVLFFVLGGGCGELTELVSGVIDGGFELRIIRLFCFAALEVVHGCEVFSILVSLMRQHVLEINAESILDGRLLRRKRHVLGSQQSGENEAMSL